MIATTDLKSNIAQTIDTFDISWGSDNYVSMIQTATLNMSCLGWTASYGVMDAIGKTVTIEWAGWNLYTSGVIRAISVQDEGNGVYVYNIQAESPWNYVGLKQLGGNGYPAQTDSDRIDQLLTEAGAYSWSDIDPTVTWSVMTTEWYSQTWSTWASDIDRTVGISAAGSTYNFQEYLGGEQSALNLLDQMSSDCRGRFYAPWSSGYLYWKSYADVAAELDSPPFTIDGATEIIDGTLRADGAINDISNVITLDDGTENPVSAAETVSIDTFGIRELNISTNLTQTDQQTVATAILATAAEIRSNLTGFTINANDWDTARGQDFIVNVINNVGACAVTGIPSAFGGPQTLLITGGTMIYDRSTVVFDVTCQTKNEVAAVQMWTQVDASYTWATYLPNTIWSEAS